MLKAAGSSWDKVVKVNIYLKNLDDFAAVNEVYTERKLHRLNPPLNGYSVHDPEL